MKLKKREKLRCLSEKDFFYIYDVITWGGGEALLITARVAFVDSPAIP